MNFAEYLRQRGTPDREETEARRKARQELHERLNRLREGGKVTVFSGTVATIDQLYVSPRYPDGSWSVIRLKCGDLTHTFRRSEFIHHINAGNIQL